MKTLIGAFFVTALLAAGVPAEGQFRDIAKSIGLDKKKELDDDTIVSGLKEALRIGTENTTEKTGQIDGYFANEAIKILMPQKLRSMEKGLRVAGFGGQLDAFVLSMNRAAEKAAPAATEIFWNAIKEMSFSDARQILQGGETAATDFFREESSEDLTEAFTPIVRTSMNEVGVTRQYQELQGQFRAIPFGGSESFDLDRYVVGKALDGLFFVLAEEERKIRTEPAARVTDLLKTVFGK